ncbi:aspartate ammonia-lyase [bacterium]|nr:aspartate ammonia-lyase [bacterium]
MLEIAKKPFEITEQAIRSHAFSHRTLKDYPIWLEALLDVKAAAARANAAASLLHETEQALIEKACEALPAAEYRDLFQADVYQGGGGIAVHTNVNEAIQAFTVEAGTPLEIKTQINASQSTSDVLATAMAIALLRLSNDLVEALTAIDQTFLLKAQEADGIRVMARTCLRDAMPAPLNQLFEGYARVVARQAASITHATQALEEVNLGGTVIGSGEGAPLTYQGLVIPFLAERTGLPLKRRENLFDAAQNADGVGRLAAVLSETATTWIKIAKDLRLMASGPLTGLDEIQLPEAIPGSSFFSNKVNPTLPETVLQACFLVLGNYRVVQAAGEHGELYLNVFESCGALKTYESLDLLARVLSKFHDYCLKNLTINAERCEHWVSIWENHHA